MFYRRKSYIVKTEFVKVFNMHFNQTNLPNQLKYGSRLIGRWMRENDDDTAEVFAIWEYDSYEAYLDIESKIRNDKEHAKRIHNWYEKHGGRDNVFTNYILNVQNDAIKSTVEGNE